MNAEEKFYYCPDCKKFHEVGTGLNVSKKLCFFCGNIKSVKTRVLTNSLGEKAQCCKKCYKDIKHLI